VTVDRFLHAANALINLAALVTAGGPLAAAGAGVTGLLSWRALRSTPSAPDLARILAADMQTRLTAHGVTDDQRALIPQMIEAGLPDPAAIIATGLSTAPLIARMEARLTDREYLLPANLTLFRATLTPALDRLLNDPDFTTRLAPAFMRAALGQLDGIDQTTRATLIAALDAQAGIRRVEDKIDLLPGQFADLLQNLNRASRDQLEALAARFEIAGVHDLTDTALRSELDKRAEDWRAMRVQIDAIPETLKQLSNLKGAAQAAFDAGRFDEVEDLLGRVHEVELDEAARTAELRAETALLRGRVDQAYTLLCTAADSFAATDPLEPARRRFKTFRVLYFHGLRYGGKGMALAARMLRPVVTRKVRGKDPVLWGYAQNGLAVALQAQGERTDGPQGAALLGQAVAAYAAALEVRTRKDHPVDWAMTQNNLGGVLGAQGSLSEGADGAALLVDSVSAYRAALEVYTLADHPVDWAMTQENLAIAHESLANHDTCTDPAPALRAALDHVTAALEVFDPDHMPYNHQKATALRDRLQARLAGMG
jgi:tetratricopeptide (TPR) repeat protein